MPTQVTNHKCPACTGPLHFAGASGKLECEYCGSAFSVEQIEALYSEKEQAAAEAFTGAEEKQEASQETAEGEWDTSGMESDWGQAGEKVKVYTCASCGAELICEDTTAAASCPYCNNPTVIPGQLSGVLKPDYVIPFKLDKDAAIAALQNYCKGKWFLPKTFKDRNKIQEIKGIYVPFWLFDGEADVDMTFKATRSHSHRQGDYLVTTTEHYHVRRAATVAFEKIPVDASIKMPDEHMDALEPFDYQELKPFSTAYLPGFFADKYGITAQDSAQRADLRAKNTAVQTVQTDAHSTYATCVPVGTKFHLKRGQVKYALLPVWMLNTSYEGKDYLFAMNGQTGKLVGNLPVSKKRFWGIFAGMFAALAAVMALILLVL